MREHISIRIVFLALGILVASGCKASRETMGSVVVNLHKMGIPETPNPDDYPGHDAVIVFQSTDAEMDLEGETETVHHTMLALFRDVAEYSTVEIPIHFGENLVLTEARTIAPDGTEIWLDENDSFLVEGKHLDGTSYSDEKIVVLNFPNTTPGSLIEYRYVIHQRSPFLFDRWAIQSTLPIRKNRYSLTIPRLFLAFFSWRYQSYNVENLGKPEVSREGNSVESTATYSWELENVAALGLEARMPPIDDCIGYVQFAPSEWVTWNDIGVWYHENAFKPSLEYATRVPSATGIASRFAKTETEVLDSIRQYVEEFRYYSINLGAGGLVPSTPDEVLERKFGDCKDKSTLLVAMLREAGVSAKPVLVKTAGMGSLDFDFPSFQFNHMIVLARVDSTEYWIDPTTSCFPLGQLPAQCEGIPVLVLEPDGTTEMRVTPERSAFENRITQKVRITLTGADRTSLSVAVAMEGQFAAEARQALLDTDEVGVRAFCQGLIAGDFVHADLDSVSVKNRDYLDRPLEVSFKLNVEGAVRKQGDLYFLEAVPLSPPLELEYFPDHPRQFPVEWGTTLFTSREIEILAEGAGLQVRTVPEDAHISSPGVDYKSAFRVQSDGRTIGTQRLVIENRRTPPSGYESLREIVGRIASGADENLVLQSGIDGK